MDQAQRVHESFRHTIIFNPDTISMCLCTLPMQELQGQLIFASQVWLPLAAADAQLPFLPMLPKLGQP